MSLRSTLKQHEDDNSNDLLDTAAKVQQRLEEYKKELSVINQRLAKQLANLKNSRVESTIRDIKKTITILMRRKKLHEKQIDYLEAQLFNIDQLTFGAISMDKDEFTIDEEAVNLTKSQLKVAYIDGVKVDNQDLIKELNSINDLISEIDKLPVNDDLYEVDMLKWRKEFMDAEIPLDDFLPVYEETV